MAIFDEKIEIRERCKAVHCVDLGESFPTSIYLQKSASIQPRSSPSKFGGKFSSLFIRLLRQQSQEAASREQLLRVLFQIVVRVKYDQIKITEEFEAMFGNVESLQQMPTINENPDDAMDLQAFVAEAKKSGMALKRNFEFLCQPTMQPLLVHHAK